LKEFYFLRIPEALAMSGRSASLLKCKQTGCPRGHEHPVAHLSLSNWNTGSTVTMFFHGSSYVKMAATPVQ
jgi:hypothetical protein